jgi:GNAT superfamily N-acetyltransferase
MLVRLDLSEPDTARGVLGLQRRSYRIEADLIGYEGIPPLHEELHELQACGEEFHGWREAGELLAAISFRRAGRELDVHRMMVDPGHFRRGLARRLLRFVMALPEVERTLVSTGAANLPACRLYESEGFTRLAPVTLPDGLQLARFERTGRLVG